MLGSAATLSRQLLRWYDRHHRDLPWRVPRDSNRSLDPYHVMISEAMLQQTRVATVIPYFQRFLGRFPNLRSLAQADEQEVLRLWQGLGYYSRARNLRNAARRIVAEHGGQVPSDLEQLLKLPGVGRYTAGAIASIAFDRRAPILDGNVARVLSRLDRMASDPRETLSQQTLWRRAEEFLPRRRCGDFNSAMMELGATVCTPRAPKCLLCPVRDHCEAAAAGVQERIPPPRKTKISPLLRREVFCIRREDAYLIEQRPRSGRWAGMWQFVTVAAGSIKRRDSLAMKLTRPRRLGQVTHALTHRRYEFNVFTCAVTSDGGDPSPRRWATLAQLDLFPLPRPHLKIAAMLREQAVKF